jgi:hypothetical protein
MNKKKENKKEKTANEIAREYFGNEKCITIILDDDSTHEERVKIANRRMLEHIVESFAKNNGTVRFEILDFSKE